MLSCVLCVCGVLRSLLFVDPLRVLVCAVQPEVDVAADEAPKPISKRKQRVLRAIARAADPVAAAAEEAAEEEEEGKGEEADAPVPAPSFPALSAKELAVRRVCGHAHTVVILPALLHVMQCCRAHVQVNAAAARAGNLEKWCAWCDTLCAVDR
jgi:hypothetical protein